ncbi:hypothetical protein [uncultured Aquimarina sp.]|uniref:tetratricopeptide repeat protein n=1 Tax=uncultured Aquimarina sp. TaxID=575652 RepID=UPI0026369D74|nr:hypothetical protein [uncultured Aquimarina sp.]
MEERDTEDILLISRYFDLDLSEEEMIEFDKRMIQDPSFKLKVKKFSKSKTLVNQFIKNKKQEQRTNKWKELISDKQTTSASYQTFKWIGGIAALFVILISSWYYIHQSNNTNLDKLTDYAWNRKVGFENYLVRNNNVDPSKKIILEAYKYFEKKEYDLTIRTLKKYNTSQLYYEDALLIRALSKHKTDHTTIALQTLDSLINLPSKRLYKEALWYKGLIYMDIKDLESAKKYLDIPNDKNSEIRLKETSN